MDWIRKLRGLVGLSALGGFAGALFGVLMTIVSSLFFATGGLSLAALASGSAPWALIGALSAGGIGLTLATVESHKSLAELSAPRVALYGAILGASWVLAMLVWLTPGLSVAVLALAAGFGASLGGGIGGALITTAKRADRGELPGPSERGALRGEDEG